MVFWHEEYMVCHLFKLVFKIQFFPLSFFSQQPTKLIIRIIISTMHRKVRKKMSLGKDKKHIIFELKYFQNGIQTDFFFNKAHFVQMLLDWGADLTASAKHGMSPLMIATLFNSMEVVKLLFDHCSDRRSISNIETFRKNFHFDFQWHCELSDRQFGMDPSTFGILAWKHRNCQYSDKKWGKFECRPQQ